MPQFYLDPTLEAPAPIAGGQLTHFNPDLPDAERHLYTFEIWSQKNAAGDNTSGWVELYPPGDSTAIQLPRTLVSTLETSLRTKFGEDELVEAVGVDVSGGELAVALQDEWPLTAVGAVLLTGLAVLLAVGSALRSRRQATLFQSIARHQMASREAERTRLAREIHDGPLQDIAALARTGNGAAAPLRGVAAELRALAAGLRPPALDEFGLGAALEDLAERHAQAARPLTVRVDVAEAARGALSDDVELALYRIAQEALTNAVMHGHARTAWVFVRLSGGVAQLIVRDDGSGLDGSGLDGAGSPDAARALVADGHFGLAGMRERSEALGGTFAVAPGPGSLGAEVTAQIAADAVLADVAGAPPRR